MHTQFSTKKGVAILMHLTLGASLEMEPLTLNYKNTSTPKREHNL